MSRGKNNEMPLERRVTLLDRTSAPLPKPPPTLPFPLHLLLLYNPGVSPGNKRLCLSGAEREAEAARSAAERARVRSEKLRILDEMRAWRTHSPGGLDPKCVQDTGKVERREVDGLGAGAPNLRVVMVGSTRPMGCTRHHVRERER